MAGRYQWTIDELMYGCCSASNSIPYHRANRAPPGSEERKRFFVITVYDLQSTTGVLLSHQQTSNTHTWGLDLGGYICLKRVSNAGCCSKMTITYWFLYLYLCNLEKADARLGEACTMAFPAWSGQWSNLARNRYIGRKQSHLEDPACLSDRFHLQIPPMCL